MTPPSIDDPSFGEMWELLGVGRKFRALPRRDAFRLLRWGPMAVADLVSEFFETERLRAVVAARGIYGAFAGPWSAGTSLGVILQAATDANAAGPATFVRGGMGALTQALAAAAQGFGAEVRTGATVSRVAVKDGRATGVVLSTGEEIRARAVVSSADPKRTLLSLVDPGELAPDFVWRIKNYRANGALAKVNLALSALPDFPSAKALGAERSRGPHPHRPGHRLPRAGLRRREARRLLAAPLLRRHDPDAHGSLARSRRASTSCRSWRSSRRAS